MTRAEMLLECVRFARESDIAEMLAAARRIQRTAETMIVSLEQGDRGCGHEAHTIIQEATDIIARSSRIEAMLIVESLDEKGSK